MTSDREYEDVIEELESVPENRESEYMEAIYDSLKTMIEFTSEEVETLAKEDDVYEADIEYADQTMEVLYHEIILQDLRDSLSYKDFVKKLKRSKELEDARNEELRNELADDALNTSEEMKESLSVNSEEIVEEFLEDAREINDNVVNPYEKAVESVIGSAIENL